MKRLPIAFIVLIGILAASCASKTGKMECSQIYAKLNLTPEQLQQVDPILQQTTQRLEDIRTETGERVFQTMEEAHRELAKHLTPEQMAKMEKMKKHHLKILHRHGKRHWRHQPPPPDAP